MATMTGSTTRAMALMVGSVLALMTISNAARAGVLEGSVLHSQVDRPDVVEVERLLMGDPVLVADPATDGTLAWRQSFVQSAEVDSRNGAAVILISVGAPCAGGIAVSPYTPVVLKDGRLVRADRLEKGMILARRDGVAVPVVAVAEGRARGRMLSVEAVSDAEGKASGHVFAVNGLVIGDDVLARALGYVPAVAKAPLRKIQR